MSVLRSGSGGLTILFALLLILLPAVTQAEEVARVQAQGTAVSWAPTVNYHSMVLTVSGGGQVMRREFSSGEAPFFQLLDDSGKALPDGSYTWELVVGAEPRERPAKASGASPADSKPRGLTQTGYFTIANGTLVGMELSESAEPQAAFGPSTGTGPATTGPEPLDQVILDDLIVDGSACIGFDCVNGESFGFDTIRIKENNLRIKAQDTSSTASYPSNDWQLTFNDSSNGGANKFSIDDIDGGRTPFTIEASAPSHSLYVDDGGRIGLGTSTPVTEVHVVDGDSPTLRLEQNGSSGFTPQTWDLAGNETNIFIRDATNGSTLPFRIRPGAPTSAIDVAASGAVGIGTSSPASTSRLHVRASSTGAVDGILLQNTLGPSRLALENQAKSTTATEESIWTLNSNGTFRISGGTDGAELKLDAAGNLTVLGTVAANNGSDTLPDYVFDPSYRLMPLDELAEFVATRKHLPSIPSQAEVNANNGMINMTSMQLLLLEKVEELTLYTIQQQREIDRLRQELSALQPKQ